MKDRQIEGGKLNKEERNVEENRERERERERERWII